MLLSSRTAALVLLLFSCRIPCTSSSHLYSHDSRHSASASDGVTKCSVRGLPQCGDELFTCFKALMSESSSPQIKNKRVNKEDTLQQEIQSQGLRPHDVVQEQNLRTRSWYQTQGACSLHLFTSHPEHIRDTFWIVLSVIEWLEDGQTLDGLKVLGTASWTAASEPPQLLCSL